MKRPALQNKRVGVLRVVFRARKVVGTFEKRATELEMDHGFLIRYEQSLSNSGQETDCCIT